MSLEHILELFSYRVVMRRTSSATLGLMLLTLVMLSFHFLFMRKPTSACPLFALECYSRWPLCRVVKPSSCLLFSLFVFAY